MVVLAMEATSSAARISWRHWVCAACTKRAQVIAPLWDSTCSHFSAGPLSCKLWGHFSDWVDAHAEVPWHLESET
eukprot:5528296-Amphidinium_carterae.1